MRNLFLRKKNRFKFWRPSSGYVGGFILGALIMLFIVGLISLFGL